MNLLTQTEVAALLRCSVPKVERLRIDGSLSCPSARRVMIELADVLSYVERMRATTWLRARCRRPMLKETAAAARREADAPRCCKQSSFGEDERGAVRANSDDNQGAACLFSVGRTGKRAT